MDSGEKIFPTLTSAVDTLRELGVQVQCGEKEHTEERLTEGWNINAKRKRNGMLTASDLRAMMEEEEEGE